MSAMGRLGELQATGKETQEAPATYLGDEAQQVPRRRIDRPALRSGRRQHFRCTEHCDIGLRRVTHGMQSLSLPPLG